MSMRDEFEKAITEDRLAAGYDEPSLSMHEFDGQLCYKEIHVQAAWWGWQAARAQGAEPVAEVVSVYMGTDIVETGRKLPVGTKLYTQPQSARVPEMGSINSALKEIASDLKHSQLVDGYTQAQREFLWSISERIKATTPQPAGDDAANPGSEWMRCPSCGDFADECEVCGGKQAPHEQGGE